MRAPRYQLALYTLLGIMVLSSLTVFPKWLIDDAYTIFRYADNLAQHGQLTFNVGEDPVDGYTGVLLPLAIAFAFRLGINPVLATHAVGVGSYVLSLILFDRLLKRLWGIEAPRFGWLLLLATAPFLYTHAYSGLETTLFTAILLMACLQLHNVLSAVSVSLRPHALLAILLLLLSLCRPEGAAFTLMTSLLVTTVFALRCKSWLPVTAYASLLGAPGLVYFLWRWDYYGFPLPNTFYAKLGDTLSLSTAASLKDFGRDYLILPAFGVAVTWMASLGERKKLLVWEPGDCRRGASLVTLGSLVLFMGAVLAQYMRSALSMNFSYRFYAPLYPVALLLLAGIWSPAFEAVRSCPARRGLFQRAVLLGLCAVLAMQTWWQAQWFFLKEMPFAAGYETGIAEMHRAAGRYLRRHVPGREWLVVYIDAGAIPFYSGLRTVDFGRLNDKYLAHRRLAPLKDRVNYFFSKNPGALVFTSYLWRDVLYEREAGDWREPKAIISDPRFGDYALVRKFADSSGKNYVEFVFLRRDLLLAGGDD
jgi:arabinofuranosyltransferase